MRYIFLIALLAIAFYSKAQRRFIGGSGQNLEIKGQVFMSGFSGYDSVTSSAHGACFFIDYTDYKIKKIACGGAGGSTVAGNGLTRSGDTIILGSTNLTDDISFSSSTRRNITFNDVSTYTIDALTTNIYRNVHVINSATSLIGMGPGLGTDVTWSYNASTGEELFDGATGTYKRFKCSGADWFAGDFSQNFFIGYTTNQTSKKLQVNGGASFNGAINIVDGGQTIGYVWTCTNATTGAGSWQAAAVGGNTNSNVGSAYRLAIPGTNNIKTVSVGPWIIWDSSTTNQLRASVDTSTAVARIRQIVSDSMQARFSTLDTIIERTFTTTDANPVYDTLPLTAGADYEGITIVVTCNAIRLSVASGYFKAIKEATYLAQSGGTGVTATSIISDQNIGSLSACSLTLTTDSGTSTLPVVRAIGEASKNIQWKYRIEILRNPHFP